MQILLINQGTDTGHAISAVGHCHRQISENPTGLVHPRTLVGVGQHLGDVPNQTGQIRDLPQHPQPGMGHHADTIGRHPHPAHTTTTLATLHPEGAFQLRRLRP